MRSEKEIEYRLNWIEQHIADDNQDFRSLDTERDTLEWLLEPPDETVVTHTHAWMETPVRLFIHTHKRGSVPHGHHGARYWGLVKEVLRNK